MKHLTKTYATLLALGALSSVATAAPIMSPVLKTPANTTLHLTASGETYCEGRLFGKKARLWLKGDTPVRYQWSNRDPRKAEMKGNTIYIQASPTATISNVVMGKGSDGNMAVQGDFKFKTNTKKGLVFTCKP